MNETTQLITAHRSIRDFKDKAIPDDVFLDLIDCAQKAATSSYMQVYSIIRVKDPEKKAALREISGQPYVEDNADLLIFVADFYRHSVIAEENNADLSPAYETTEGFIVATVDATLAAQNLTIAAESYGLGACYIGSLRNNMQKVIDILQLPKLTYPLFGLVLGYPDQSVDAKPRLPVEEILHVDQYDTDKDKISQHLSEYDKDIKDYYLNRDSNHKLESWTGQMVKKMQVPTREDVDGTLKKQGFLKQ